MDADNLWKRINALDNPYKSYVLSSVFGAMQSRMTEADLKLILPSLEHWEKVANKEADKEAAYFGK